VIGAAVRRRRATVEDARLVEMDVRLDQPGRDQPAGGIDRLAVGLMGSGYCRDLVFIHVYF
jgi:hypothetical protein